MGVIAARVLVQAEHNGAARERKAFRAYLRRKERQDAVTVFVSDVLAWVLAREKRYAKRKGGL